MKITKNQKEEMIHRIEVRKDTVEDDPWSGDSFENTPGTLLELKQKLQKGKCEFTSSEVNWIKREAKDWRAVAEFNRDNEGITVQGQINSMNNLIKKLEQ